MNVRRQNKKSYLRFSGFCLGFLLLLPCSIQRSLRLLPGRVLDPIGQDRAILSNSVFERFSFSHLKILEFLFILDFLLGRRRHYFEFPLLGLPQQLLGSNLQLGRRLVFHLCHFWHFSHFSGATKRLLYLCVWRRHIFCNFARTVTR